MALETRFAAAGDLRSVWEVFTRSFDFPDRKYDEWMEGSDPTRVLAVFDADRAVAASKVVPFGQWYGGRRVPVAGYSPVAVTPEYRGRGLGRAVTSGQFADLRDRGDVVAGLFPSSVALYRSVGFELAGTFVDRRIPAAHLAAMPGGRSVVVRLGRPDDVAAVHACYDRIAPSRHGHLDRPPEFWPRKLPLDLAGVHLYVVDRPGPPGELAGYVVYRHSRGRPPYDFSIRVLEALADDADVSAALWRVVGSSGAQAPDVDVAGPIDDPLLLQLPSADPTAVRSETRWMVRLIDAAGAVAARGYRRSTSVRVELEIDDQHAPWNAGRWVLEVVGAAAELRRGGAGTVRVGIGGLSSLWAGYASAGTLAATGSLYAPDRSALDSLDDVFAGPAPALLDYY